MLLVRRVQGDSMLPALRPDSIVVAVRFGYRLRPDDVVIVRHEGLEKVKRVKQVQVDKVYIEGDNTRYSTDSRHFGWLHKTTVRGKVIWPKTTTNAKQKFRT